MAAEVGATNVGVRLEPTGLYNGTYGDERVETWSYLCEQIAATYAEDNTGGGATGRLSYAHFIEPRMDRVEQVGERFWKGWSLPEVSNAPFRDILQKAKIPCITCGGWNASTAESAVDKSSGEGWDAVAFAKWFVSNPDLPERIRLGKPLQAYDRSRFYGSWDGIRENGYVDYLDWRAAEEKAILEEVSKRDVVVETKVKEVKA